MSAWRAARLGIFPVLAALYPVLALAAGNTGASFGGFARAALAAIVVGMAMWGLAALLTRDPDRRTLAALAGVVWFSGYGAWERAAWGTPLGPRPVAFAVPLLLLAGAVAWVARTRRNPATLARIARTTAVIVLVFPLVTLAARPRHAVANAAAGTTAPHPVADSLPSIYLIVLDKYSGSRSLAAYHGFDNAPFESRLREMGFVTGRAAAPNYPHTWLSLPSILNWEYADAILAGRPQREWMGKLRSSLDDNRTARYLRSWGYEYVFVPSTFPFTDGSTVADRIVAAPRRAGGLDLWAAWVAETPLRVIPARHAPGHAAPTPFPAQSAGEMRRKMEAIAATAGGSRPRFVFAHLLVPHEPFIFNADCTPREPYWPASEAGAEGERAKAAYLAQVACVNRLVERMVAGIIRRSRVPPVILLQADHGHGFITLETATGRQPPRAVLAPAQVAERMDAFAVYHLPNGGDAALYPGMTAVNLIPAVLNRYLDARIPLQEDRLWWATLHPPFGFERIR